MEEQFKIIPSFPDYEISNKGRVKTLSRRIRYIHAVTGKEHYRESVSRFLKVQYNNNTGYKFYQLYLNKKMYNKPVHKLVAEAFIEKIDGLDYINHKDGNKHNNTIENLERCTDSYNHDHATKTGLKAKGRQIGSSKLDDKCVKAIKHFLSISIPHSEISKAFGISRSTVTLINKNKIWRHISH